jgi:hypothetical protein
LATNSKIAAGVDGQRHSTTVGFDAKETEREFWLIHEMPSKEIIVIGDNDKEVADFLEKLRVAGQLRVQLGPDVFVVRMSAEGISTKGRDFLTRGGPVED